MANTFDFALVLIAAAVFAVGVLRKARLIWLGTPDNRLDGFSDRVLETFKAVFGHARVRREEPHGTHHYLLFLAFTVPLLVVFLIQFGIRLPSLFSGLTTLALEAIAIAGVWATTKLLLRRYREKPEELDNKIEDGWVYVVLYAIFLTGFGTEALRIATSASVSDILTPVGLVVGLPLKVMSTDTAADLLGVVWRVHIYIVLFALASLPYGKLSHVLLGPANIALANRGPKGAFTKIDIENSEIFGVGEVENFTWKQLLDLEACVRCGRCQAKCPAYSTGKTLNPKKVIQDLRTNLTGKAPYIRKGKAESYPDPMIGGSGVGEEDIWSCTTCRHCMEVCPMQIEHVDKIVDMRRHLVLMEGQMPNELIALNKNIENNFNPWGVGWSERNDWMRRRNIHPRILTKEEKPEFDLLLWVGCAGSFDDRYQRVIASLVKILDHAGISFGVLGEAEKCCGDPARSTGNEYLYQTLAEENIATMNALGVTKIIAPCPHCLKSISKEYPQFGGNFEVVHHSDYLLDLVDKHRIRLSREMPQNVTLHDSCYLSRYAGITAEPRNLLGSVGGLELTEMERHGEDSFCCGAGGGRMWMEEEGERINNKRADEAMSTGADTIASACPFCLTMLDDGVKAAGKEEEFKVLDIAEIIERALV